MTDPAYLKGIEEAVRNHTVMTYPPDGIGHLTTQIRTAYLENAVECIQETELALEKEKNSYNKVLKESTNLQVEINNLRDELNRWHDQEESEYPEGFMMMCPHCLSTGVHANNCDRNDND